MPRVPKLDDVLADLQRLRATGAADARERLTRALAYPSGRAVAKAAAIAREAGFADLCPQLLAAFEGLMKDPAKRDPGCTGKAALVEALAALGHDDDEVYRRGIAHVQKEPVWGGTVDTAAELRALAALALARSRRRDVLDLLAELLADPEPAARAGAARALAAHGSACGTPLLRLKLRAGDDSPAVSAECLLALLRLDEAAGLALATRLLAGGQADAMLEALAESRLPAAVPLLRAWLQGEPSASRRAAGYRALGALRRDEALDLLLETVQEGPLSDAVAALEALAGWATQPRVRDELRRRVEGRGEAALRTAWTRRFAGVSD